MTVTEREASLRARLIGPDPGRRVLGWVGPLVAMLVGGLLRFWDLGNPHQLVFDETYYVKQGWSMIQWGVELRNNPAFGDQIDQRFTAGTWNIYGTEGDLVVHPPVGKWVIGAGEWLFGIDSSFGWRFSVCVIGTLAILLVGRITRRLLRSSVLGTLAALLVAFDGDAFVHSRTSLLDPIVMIFGLLGFGALLLDRDRTRGILAAKVATLDDAGLRRLESGDGPSLGWRPWRLVAAVLLGLDMATKWSGGGFLAAFGIMTVCWDLGARRTVGVRHWLLGGWWRDGLRAFVTMVPLACLTYLVSWVGWFRSDDGYDRHWADQTSGGGPFGWVPAPLRSWWHYQSDMLNGAKIDSPHPWQSDPWSWLIQGRPTLFFAENPDLGTNGCTYEHCTKMIHSIGTLTVWWGGTAALVVMLFMWWLRRDWRAGAIWWGIIGGYLPWFFMGNRTIFAFYEIAFEPYVVMACAYGAGLVLGMRHAWTSTGAPVLARRIPPWSAKIRVGAVGLFAILTVALFLYFWPIYTAQLISRDSWWQHMWFPSWV